jgi:hypothetical protein
MFLLLTGALATARPAQAAKRKRTHAGSHKASYTGTKEPEETTPAPGAAAEVDERVSPPVAAPAPPAEPMPASPTATSLASSTPVPAPSAAAAAPDSAAAEEGGGLFEQSQSSAKEAGGGAAAEAPPFTLNGYARGDAFAGKAIGVNQGEMKSNYGELSLQVRTRKEPYGDAFADARVMYGLQDHAQATTLQLREAYVNTYLGPLDLRLGQQIIVWGRADVLNPTSNLTPTDLRVHSPVEDDRRIGNVGARAFLRFAPFRLEGVWMPMYLPTTLPSVGLPEFVSYGPPKYPSPNLQNGTVAGRLHLELAKFETSVSYLQGFAPLPGLTRGTIVFDVDNPAVQVSRTAYAQQVLGFDFSTALGDVLGLRGEAAYRRPVDNYKTNVNVARRDLQYVLGVDHAFGPVSVIAQYMGRYVLDWAKEKGPLGGADPDQLKMDPAQVNATIRGGAEKTIDDVLRQTNQILFNQTAKQQHLGTLRLEWLTLHDTLSLSVLALANFTTREWALAPKIGWHISDTLMAYVGAEIFRGPQDTLFGLIQDELSAGYFELRYTF